MSTIVSYAFDNNLVTLHLLSIFFVICKRIELFKLKKSSFNFRNVFSIADLIRYFCFFGCYLKAFFCIFFFLFAIFWSVKKAVLTEQKFFRRVTRLPPKSENYFESWNCPFVVMYKWRNWRNINQSQHVWSFGAKNLRLYISTKNNEELCGGKLFLLLYFRTKTITLTSQGDNFSGNTWICSIPVNFHHASFFNFYHTRDNFTCLCLFQGVFQGKIK